MERIFARNPGRLAMQSALRLALAVAASCLVACASQIDLNDPFNDRGNLNDTQREFGQYMRWGVIEKASQFVVPDQRDEFESLAPHLTDLRITEFETLEVKMLSETEATALVRYRGYSMSSPIERTITLEETWTREPESKFWMVRIEVNRLREALGLAAG